jgi:hypothetical protein
MGKIQGHFAIENDMDFLRIEKRWKCLFESRGFGFLVKDLLIFWNKRGWNSGS